MQDKPSASLARIRVVLVEPTHPGNVGSAARAMKTMGLGDLRVVGGCGVADPGARANAANATAVLDRAQCHGTVTEALAGAGLVLGLTARTRRRSAPPLLAREAGALAVAEAPRHPVALVFGREHAGLTNDELGHCHHAVHIPANPDYPAMNLAAAVQVVCYEVYTSLASGPGVGAAGGSPAAAEHLEGFYAHLAEVITAVGYEQSAGMPRLMRRLRRLFNRARPEPAELNILRGILSAVQRHTKDADESV